jgi:hypothetical protein
MHELNSIGDDRIIIATDSLEVDSLSDMGLPDQDIRVKSGGFRECDATTGKDVLQWQVIDHIPVIDSMMEMPDESHRTWDAFHIDSVTKDARGD